MKFNKVIPGLAAAVIGGSMFLAPIASAATVPATTITASAQASGGADPLLPYGTETQVPGRVGYVDSSHDEVNTTNGQVDVPF